MIRSNRAVRRALLAFAATLWAPAAAAAPVDYKIESNHTYPSFKVPHLGISYWRGKFTKTTGAVVLDRAARTGTVDITVEASSIDFGHQKMNEHAVSEDFFNVAAHPTISYRGKIKFEGDQPSSVHGQLTLLGATQPLELDIESLKCIQHPVLKKEVCGAEVSGAFNRADFGMTKYADGPLGEVELDIQVEALKAD